MNYYLLDTAQRPLHPLHSTLRPSGPGGLSLGLIGTLLLFMNLAYLVRRSLIRVEWLGQLRVWMAMHVFTGVVGPLFILLHSALQMRSALASIAALSLMVVVATGFVGRYIYSRTPRSVQGKELELEDIRKDLGAYLEELGRLGLPMDIFAAPSEVLPDAPKPLAQALFSLMKIDRENAREYDRLREVVRSSPGLTKDSGRILTLGSRYFRERQWLVRYHELRSLMSGWRFFHRWFAIVMLIVAAFHIAVAVRMGEINFSHVLALQ